MKGLRFTIILLAAALVAAGVSRAQTPADNAPVVSSARTPEDNASGASGLPAGLSPAEIKRPSDFAPPEQIVAGRDTMDFRREGSLLSKMSREIPKVDVAALSERKLAMYDGERFLRGPAREGGPRGPLRPADRPRSAGDDGGTLRFGWLGWTLAGVLVAGVVAVWRLGWFVPFSRRDRREHVLQAASAARRSRAVKKLGPLIALAKRDE